MGQFIDMIGKRYGKLQVIKRFDDSYPVRWECRCDCGNIKNILASQLRRGKTKHCGCAMSLIGKRFGRLIVIKKARSHTHETRWLCQCDCGNQRIILGGSLKSKTKPTKSCGCLMEEHRSSKRLEFGESSFNQLFNSMKRDAGYRNHEFLLDKNDVKRITSMPCYYCGKPPQQKTHRSTGFGEYTYNGIDRVDNSIGYVIDNVVPCCGQCNKMKFKYSVEEFKQQVIHLYNHWASKK